MIAVYVMYLNNSKYQPSEWLLAISTRSSLLRYCASRWSRRTLQKYI